MNLRNLCSRTSFPDSRPGRLVRFWMRSLIVAALLGVAAVSPASAQKVEKLAWMEGHWAVKSATEEVQESWLGPRGDMMVATNLTQTTGRGASFEFLRIGEKDGRAVYFASPGGRPPVEFPVKQMTADSVVFENLARDYPQRVMYRRDGDALVARIEGTRGGKEASEEWRFVRAR